MFPASTKILIVDDMPTIRELVRNQLRDLGYRNVSQAENGEDAWAMLQQAFAGEPFALVISDWNMPKMTGLEFLKIVRMDANFSKLPFILLTSESERDQVTEAVLAGVSQYIVKPFTAKSFEDKLKSVWTKLNPPK